MILRSRVTVWLYVLLLYVAAITAVTLMVAAAVTLFTVNVSVLLVPEIPVVTSVADPEITVAVTSDTLLKVNGEFTLYVAVIVVAELIGVFKLLGDKLMLACSVGMLLPPSPWGP